MVTQLNMTKLATVVTCAVASIWLAYINLTDIAHDWWSSANWSGLNAAVQAYADHNHMTERQVFLKFSCPGIIDIRCPMSEAAGFEPAAYRWSYLPNLIAPYAMMAIALAALFFVILKGKVIAAYVSQRASLFGKWMRT